MKRTFWIALPCAAALFVLGAGYGVRAWYAAAEDDTEKKAAAKEDAPAAANRATDRPDDRKEIAKVLPGLLAAFAKADAATVGGFYTAEAEYLSAGEPPIRGRKSLEKAYADYFAKQKDTKVEGGASELRFVGQDTAVETGSLTRKNADGEVLSTSRYSLLLARENGKWRIAIMREWAKEEAAPSLSDLAWLVGDWQGKTDSGEVRTSYAYDEHKVFIHGKFKVTNNDGKVTRSGLQIIGRDPADGRLRSWVFDSEGGYGNARWERDGASWKMDSAGVVADGSATTAVNLLTPLGKDAYTWQSVRRTLGGEERPDSVPVKVTRVKKAAE